MLLAGPPSFKCTTGIIFSIGRIFANNLNFMGLFSYILIQNSLEI
jgi:hypothetical protein